MEKNTILEHIWSILCASSSVDRDSNLLTISNVIEELTISSIPLTLKEGAEKTVASLLPINLEIISFWQRSDSGKGGEITKEGELELIDPNGKVLSTRHFQLVFQKGFKRVRIRLKIDSINIGVPGEYSFMLKVKDSNTDKYTKVVRLPIDIKIEAKL